MLIREQRSRYLMENDADNGYTNNGSFKIINNTELYSYNGKGNTISKLKSLDNSGEIMVQLFSEQCSFNGKKS